MTPAQLGIVAAIGFTGSFFGVVSGGGGLLIIPGLIMSGMTGPAAVASSRVGVLSVSLAGGYRYRRAGLIDATGGLALVTAGLMIGAAMRTFVGLAVGAVTSVIVGIGGQIDPAPAAVLFCATLLGSYLGASFSLRRGEGYARQPGAVFAILAGLKLLV